MTSVPPPGHRPSGESWSWSPEGGERRSSRGQRLEPLSRRLLGVVGVLSALLIAAVVYAWTGGGENSLNPIAEAATHTRDSTGARLAIRAVYTSPLLPAPVTARGAGAYNGRSGRSRAWLEMQIPTTAATVRLDAVGDDQRVFVRSSLLNGKLPAGDRWLLIEPGVGHSPETTVAGNSDARGQLEMLQAVSGQVERVGRQKVRGAETTLYRAHLDARRYAGRLRQEGNADAARQYERLAKSTPSDTVVEVWVDDGRDLIRQARITSQAGSGTGTPLIEVGVTIAYFDFGATPRIELPSRKQAFDATLIGRAELGLLNADSVHVPQPAPGTEPLSKKAFVARAKGIVGEAKREMSALTARSESLGEGLKRAIRLHGLQGRPTLEAFHRAAAELYEPLGRRLRRMTDRLARLAPPRPLEARYRRLMRLLVLQVDVYLAETRALEIGEYKLAHDLSRRLKGLSHRTSRSGTGLGLGSCRRTVTSAIRE